MIDLFDSTVADMMNSLGTRATFKIAVSEEYDTTTSTNIVNYREIPVKAMFFDYLDKKYGLGTEGKTLIQSGDKQVYVQPPQKVKGGLPLPHLDPNKDFFVHNGKTYRIVFLKQHNPSMTDAGCVMIELYIRE